MERFKPDSVLGSIWREHWKGKSLGDKNSEEIQKEYENFCRKLRLPPCWEPIGPYPVTELKSVHETAVPISSIPTSVPDNEV